MAGRTPGNGKSFQWLMAHVAYMGDDCLPWPFSVDGRVGRGRLGVKGQMWWAHRLMCELAHGKPPTPKHQATHSCGKGHYGCVNPRHLSWQTNSQNQIDRWRKNGSRLGNRTGSRTALTAQQIAEIRAAKDTQVGIAKRLGVSLGCVQYWQRHTRPPAPRGTSRSAILWRKRGGRRNRPPQFMSQ